MAQPNVEKPVNQPVTSSMQTNAQQVGQVKNQIFEKPSQPVNPQNVRPVNPTVNVGNQPNNQTNV